MRTNSRATVAVVLAVISSVAVSGTVAACIHGIGGKQGTGIAPPGSANSGNTPTTGGGDCWQALTPWSCRNTWPNTKPSVYFRAIDQYSGGAPSWTTGVQAAINAWNAAPGPQFFSFTGRPNDTWVYIQDNVNGQWDLANGFYGITWNCPTGGPCNDTGDAMNVQWTEIHLNHNMLDGLANIDIQNTTGHESGHAMMLAHNKTDNQAIMYTYHNPPIGGPNSNDIGVYPGCSGGGGGVRCVYGQGD